MIGDDKPTAALAEVERLLDQWLQALQKGGEPEILTPATLLAFAETDAPPALVREVSRLAAIVAVDKKIKQVGWSQKDLALFKAARTMLAANIPPEDIMPLVELHQDIRGGAKRRKGKKPRKLSYRTALATFAAAVTVLKKGQTVDAAIAEVATPNRISREDIKNLRNRLNRGLVSDGTEDTYKLMLAMFRGMARAEIMSVLAGARRRFCT